MNCKYCGQPLKDGARFCTNCGALNDEESTFSASSSPFPTASKQFGAKKKLKNNVSNTKTPFFWLSKLLIIAALICFIMPFMEIKFGLKNYDISKVEMTGRELVFGLDGDKTSGDTSSKNNLNSEKIIFAAVLAVAAIVMNKSCAAVPSAISAIFVLAFINGADGDYTFMNKKIKDWDDLITLEFKPGIYIVMALLVVATALAAFDYIKRVKMAKNETEFY